MKSHVAIDFQKKKKEPQIILSSVTSSFLSRENHMDINCGHLNQAMW